MLILQDARARGCRAVFTFDKTLSSKPGILRSVMPAGDRTPRPG